MTRTAINWTFFLVMGTIVLILLLAKVPMKTQLVNGNTQTLQRQTHKDNATDLQPITVYPMRVSGNGSCDNGVVVTRITTVNGRQVVTGTCGNGHLMTMTVPTDTPCEKSAVVGVDQLDPQRKTLYGRCKSSNTGPDAMNKSQK